MQWISLCHKLVESQVSVEILLFIDDSCSLPLSRASKQAHSHVVLRDLSLSLT